MKALEQIVADLVEIRGARKSPDTSATLVHALRMTSGRCQSRCRFAIRSQCFARCSWCSASLDQLLWWRALLPTSQLDGSPLWCELRSILANHRGIAASLGSTALCLVRRPRLVA